MISLKVAFQGGGARLVTLIAAAHALRDMQERGEVKVEMVAGASAGSVAACMFSQSKSFDDQIECITKIGGALINEIQHFPRGRILQFANVALGRPLLNERAVRKLILKLFYDGNAGKSLTLSSLSIPTYIALSDVFARQKIVVGPRDEAELSDVLCDSCALPFVFRTHKSPSGRVDGGITSNLPADIILNQTPSDVIPLAFRFPPELTREVPKDFADYAIAVISTAIDASVESSANSVTANGGCVCELPNHFNTLDFSDALKAGLHPSRYTTTKNSFENDIRNALEPYRRRVQARSVILGNTRPEQALFDAHAAQMDSFPFKITESTTVACCYSLYDKGDTFYQPYDHIYQTYAATSENPIFLLRIGVPLTSLSLMDRESCVVKDVDGNELHTHDFPVNVADPKGRYDKVKYILVFLDKPALPAVMPLQVTYRTIIPSSMGELKRDGDWLKTRTSDFGNLSRENQILLVPQRFPSVQVEDLVAGSNRLPEGRRQKALFGTDGHWYCGRPMTAPELAQSLKPELPSRLGWQSVGWVAADVPADHFSGALFTTKVPFLTDGGAGI